MTLQKIEKKYESADSYKPKYNYNRKGFKITFIHQ